ncbi:unnamed protein product, partial [Iphiclides podalirius]
MASLGPVFRRLGTSLANHRASLSSELGSLWDFIRIDKDRRRSAPSTTYESIDSKSPVKLARDLLQVVQETVLCKRLEDTPKRCPLVKEESDLTASDDEESADNRIANLIDFFFTIVKSQKESRKGSGGSCFRGEASPEEEEKAAPNRVNTELEKKMETLMEFLATTGCMESEREGKDEKKITLMEFLFGPDDGRWARPSIELNGRGVSLSESKVDVRDLAYIDESPADREETLVEMLLKYMEGYGAREKGGEAAKSLSVTPSLSEKSKSDTTISRLETFSDVSKTKSDSTLTYTQDTVVERERANGRRVSETVVDLSFVKEDLEAVFEEATLRVCELRMMFDEDTMSEQEDLENFNAYTKPPALQCIQCLPYSVELSDIMEEEEPSSRGLDRGDDEDRLALARRLAEDLVRYIEDRIQRYRFEDSDDESSCPSTEDYSREYELSTRSISLIDLRNIPDFAPSAIAKPKVLRLDKSTSTTEISESISELYRRIDSACMTEDTALGSGERSERAMDKLESLHKFFSRSRLEIIDESLEENGEKATKNPKQKAEGMYFNGKSKEAGVVECKTGQASLDDVEDLQDDNDAPTADKDASDIDRCVNDFDRRDNDIEIEDKSR